LSITIEHSASFDADGDPSNGYEAAAADFVALRSASSIGVSTVRAWSHSLEPGASILDVGCGNGLPISAALVREGFEVFGIDASPTLVADFRQKLPEEAVACEAIQTSSLFGRTFDAAVAIGVLFLLSPAEQRETIGRIAAALNPGGGFLFTSPREPCAWSDALTGRRSLSLGRDEYTSILADFGLSLVGEYSDEGDNHYYAAVRPEQPRSAV
jgi:2-polyprenyl-3-methyl-5-hydroxy-6-metoxy-1,4-benzoquinol methylase